MTSRKSLSAWPGNIAPARRQVSAACRNFEARFCVIAYLDAGDIEKAEMSLMRYLNIDSVKDIGRRLDHFIAWQHALLSRFIADVQDKNLIAGFRKWAKARIHALDDPHHPWQLRLLHLGRMAQATGDVANACACYRQNVQHCLSGTSGPTVQCMALMPLSYWRLPDLRME